MAVFVLRQQGVSRREAGLMPRWERELLVETGKKLLGIGQPEAAAGQGEYSASDLAILTTPGIGG